MKLRAIFFFVIVTCFSCTKKKSIAPIPFDFEIAARINCEEIITEIAKDKITDFSIFDLFKSGTEDSTKQEKGIKALLNNPREAGIDLLEDIWIFKKNNEAGVIVSIDDYEKFKEFLIQNISDRAYYENDLNALLDENTGIVWNHDKAIILFTASAPNTTHLFSFFNKNSRYFQPKILEEDSDKEILIWTNNRILKNYLPDELHTTISPDSFSFTIIDFEDGRMNILNENLLTNQGKLFYSKVFNEHLFKKPGANLGIHLNIQNLPISKETVNKNLLQAGLSGEIYLKVDSIKTFQKIYKKIELDEEFNSVEINDTILEYYPGFLTFLPVTNADSANFLLKDLEKKGLLISEKNYYKLTLSSFPVYLYFMNGAINISDQPFQSLSGKESFVNINISSPNEPLYFTYNYNDSFVNFIDPALSKINSVQFILKEKNNKLTLEGSIKTSLNDEYSLLTIMEIFKSLGEKFIPDRSLQ